VPKSSGRKIKAFLVCGLYDLMEFATRDGSQLLVKSSISLESLSSPSLVAFLNGAW
jgi:hypothetical protein